MKSSEIEIGQCIIVKNSHDLAEYKGLILRRIADGWLTIEIGVERNDGFWGPIGATHSITTPNLDAFEPYLIKSISFNNLYAKLTT